MVFLRESDSPDHAYCKMGRFVLRNSGLDFTDVTKESDIQTRGAVVDINHGLSVLRSRMGGRFYLMALFRDLHQRICAPLRFFYIFFSFTRPPISIACSPGG